MSTIIANEPNKDLTPDFLCPLTLTLLTSLDFSEDIRVRVVNDIDRDMIGDEEKLFYQIQEAWDQWQYILQQLP